MAVLLYREHICCTVAVNEISSWRREHLQGSLGSLIPSLQVLVDKTSTTCINADFIRIASQGDRLVQMYVMPESHPETRRAHFPNAESRNPFMLYAGIAQSTHFADMQPALSYHTVKNARHSLACSDLEALA